MNSTESTSWTLPDQQMSVETGPGRSEKDNAERLALAGKLAEIANQKSWSKAEAARQIGISDGILNQWYSGKYKGRFDKANDTIQRWFHSFEAVETVTQQMPVSPPFLSLGISLEIKNMLRAAQLMPGMVMVNCEAGLGKTMAARNYRDTTANTFMATVSPHTKTVHGCLMEIADSLGINHKNSSTVVRAIGERVKRTGAGTLLIVDESQNLVDDAINQLRHFVDNYGCGIALLGNTESYTRFNNWAQGPKYGQLKRRIFKRIKYDRATTVDLKAFIKAWGIHDAEQVNFLIGVGKKPGALGQIDMTVKLAKMIAAGGKRDLELMDLKKAWANRDVGGM